jgi:hypothetical protein
MRNCTKSQNAMNRKSYHGSSKYLGVKVINNKYIVANIKPWHADQLYLGKFLTEEDAARAYDAKAKELHGEFANLNFKD